MLRFSKKIPPVSTHYLNYLTKILLKNPKTLHLDVK